MQFAEAQPGLPPSLMVDLVRMLGAALIAGGLAMLLRQPVIVGYLIAGIVVGPQGLNLVGELESVTVLAEIGVALLMFAIGVELSISSLARVGKVALGGGALQIAVTGAAGFGLGLLLRLDTLSAAFLGAIVALSSTVVALRILGDRGELETIHGRITTGVALVQDLSVVPLMVILPAFAAPADQLLMTLGRALVVAAAVLVGTYLLGTRVVPVLLRQVAATRSRELFLLTVLFLAIGTAAGVTFAGLSLALGAFIAGVVVSESEFSHEAMALISPVRDLFAAVFFVSVGMLVDPAFVVANPGAVLALVVMIALGKTVITFGAVRLFRYSGAIAILVGLALAQIGEFSFVLAQMGVDQGLLTREFSSLVVSVATLSLLLAPALPMLGPRAAALIARVPVLGGEVAPAPVAAHNGLSGHVIIAGYGRSGRVLARVLAARRFRYFVIDYDPNVIQELRRQGVPCAYGDAANPAVLHAAGLGRARVLALAVPDSTALERAVAVARAAHPRIDIVVKAPPRSVVRQFQTGGIDELVDPALEAGFEIVRHTLHRFGLSSQEIAYIVSRMRSEERDEEDGVSSGGEGEGRPPRA